jgi:hypothetical protein
MTEPSDSTPPVVPDLKEQLVELARQLREARHLQGDAQQELANLLGALSASLGDAPSAQTSHLAASAAHVVRALNEQHHVGLLAAAKRRLEEAAVASEAKAPVATGIARRLVDVLAELGI